jgi:formylglycine-generating enzyme required for sulfatase activity
MRWDRFSVLLLSASILSCASVGGGLNSPTEFADCEYCPEMVKISTGTYVMGDSTGEGRDNERPAHPVSISEPFAISKFPITVKQFRAFVNASGYATKAERNPKEGCWGIRDDVTIGWLPNQNWNNNNLKQEENHPVVCVTWNDASEYIQWLAKTTGFSYRLPSEAEWEYAARAGEEGKYHFGDDPGDVCEHINHADYQMVRAWDADTGVSECDDGFLNTSPVGSYPANRFGLYDMYGNVWEWVADCYLPHLPMVAPTQQATHDHSCDEYTLRGASWASRPEGVTTSYRTSAEADTRTVDYGFRVVRELESN